MNDAQFVVALVPNAEMFTDWQNLVDEAERLDDEAADALLLSLEAGAN